MTYTPGPWRTKKEKWDIVVIGSDEDYIAYVPVEELVLPEESANARLIAAAPDLVAALEDILESYKKASPRLYDLIEAAEQALAQVKEK